MENTSVKVPTATPWSRLILISLCLLILVFIYKDKILSGDGWDPDDQLRMVQLRDFLGGQSWFDTTQYRMNPPGGAPMHWSRLIELPLAAIVILLTPLFGTAAAEMAAAALVPIFCFGGIAFLLSGIAEKIGGRGAGIVTMLLTMTSPALLLQLRPMRIDHHGWQIFCAVLALSTLFWAHKRRAALVMGAALATWVHISLEGAPMTAAFFLMLGWRWIAEAGLVKREEGPRLFWTLCSFAGLSLSLFLGTQANGFGARQYCDTVSPAHIWAILGAVTVLLPAIYLNPVHRTPRLIAAIFAGAVAIGLLIWLAPNCTTGAFGDMDPVVREYWYIYVNEGLPIWHQELAVALTLITPLFVAVVALWIVYRGADALHRPLLSQLGFFLIYASILSLLVFRTVSVATAFTIVPVALCLVAAFNRYRSEPVLVQRLILVPGAIILLTSGIVAGTVAGAFSDDKDSLIAINAAKRADAVDQCESLPSIKALTALPIGNIVAPFDIGPAILLTSQHKILASGHHRNSQGMRDQIDIFRLPPMQARTIIARHAITYIVACSGASELRNYVRKNPSGLWAQLDNGKTPDWLEYRGQLGRGMKVWRVR
jgi:hypothetical protein